MKPVRHPDAAELLKLMAHADMGWWSVDFGAQMVYCSDFLRDLLGLEKNELPTTHFVQFIREDHRERLLSEFSAFKVNDRFDEQFPLQTPNGEVWLRVILAEKSYDAHTHNLTAIGSTQRLHISNPEELERMLLEKNFQDILKKNKHTETLLRKMPIGYLQLKLLRDHEHRPIDYLFVNINNKASQILGSDPSQLIGKTASEMGYSTEAYLDNLANIPCGEHLRRHWVAPRTNRHCRNYIYKTPNDNSEIVILIEDITETINTHKALYANENLLHNIFLNTPVGIALFDHNGKLTKMNEKWIEIFGIENPSEILGVSIFANPCISEEIKNSIHNGTEVDVNIKYDFRKISNYYQCSRTDSIDCMARIRFLYNRKGEVENMLVINIDNTEFNRTSNRVAQFEDMFHHISTFARVGYACYNLLDRQGYAQGVWHENYGETADTPLNEIIGKYRYLHPEDRLRMIDSLDNFAQGTISSLDETLRVVHPDGKTTWTRTTLIIRKYAPQQGFIEIIGINYDITELITARERAEESNRLKSAFLAHMSHEIRTPLNAIVGFSEILASASDHADFAEYTKVIRHNNTLLLQIISDVLDLSTIEAGLVLSTTDLVDLAELCRETALVFETQAPKEVTVTTDTPLPACRLKTSRKGVAQILSNFMSNAMKFTAKGSIHIGLRDTGDQIEIYVRDTGIGIPEKMQSSIFERFIKVNEFSQGTGLGLSICKEIAELLGGHISLTSTSGHGSCFSLCLPKK